MAAAWPAASAVIRSARLAMVPVILPRSRPPGTAPPPRSNGEAPAHTIGVRRLKFLNVYMYIRGDFGGWKCISAAAHVMAMSGARQLRAAPAAYAARRAQSDALAYSIDHRHPVSGDKHIGIGAQLETLAPNRQKQLSQPQ